MQVASTTILGRLQRRRSPETRNRQLGFYYGFIQEPHIYWSRRSAVPRRVVATLLLACNLCGSYVRSQCRTRCASSRPSCSQQHNNVAVPERSVMVCATMLLV